MVSVRATRFPIGAYYGDPSEALPPQRPEQSAAHPAPTINRHEPIKLVADRKPKHSRRRKARRQRRVVFVVTDFTTNQGSSTVVDRTPNNKPSYAERARFLKRLGVA